jgi:hypothetical protein
VTLWLESPQSISGVPMTMKTKTLTIKLPSGLLNQVATLAAETAADTGQRFPGGPWI